MDTIKVGLIGVGNCAAALVEGVEYYRQLDENDPSGLICHDIGGYRVEDIQFVAAFDVDEVKVGKDLHEAIHAGLNCTRRSTAVMPPGDVIVQQAPRLDGIGTTYKTMIGLNGNVDQIGVEDINRILIETKPDVLVNYLPVGSEQATRFWAHRALDTGCAFVNAIPVFIANDEWYQNAFHEANLPLIGDDIKSQYGATIIHRMLVHLCGLRGFAVDRTYQLNFGGNMDFANMLDRERLDSKKTSKTNAVLAELGQHDQATQKGNTHISPSDYVPWLKDRKWAYIRLEGRGFADAPFSIEAKLEVWDSPNSAGVVVDAVRYAKLALDSGIGGVLHEAAAVLMKSPPVQVNDEKAIRDLEEWASKLVARHVAA